MKQRIIIAGVCLLLGFALVEAQGPSPAARPPRPGVATPGVKRDIAVIKPLGVFAVPGNPDWQVVTKDAVWVTSSRKNIVGRLDPKTNTVVTLVETGPRPCSGLVEAFGSIWVPICGEQDKPDTKGLQRIDPKTNKVTKTIELGAPATSGAMAFGEGSLWVSITGFPITRIDPQAEKVVQQFYGEGSGYLLTTQNSVWLANPATVKVVRLDTRRIAATLAE